MSEKPDVDLKILTAKQRQAYLLRQQGLSFRAIGENMGIIDSTARMHFNMAERRLREKAHDDAQNAWSETPILISTTQGQVQALLDCLDWLDGAVRRKVYRSSKNSQDRLPYSVRVLKGFVEQLQMDLYGEVHWDFLSDLKED